MWTAFGHGANGIKTKWDRWISAPIGIMLVPAVLLVLYLSVTSPLSVPLAFIPLVVTVSAFVWLDRVEPEPLASRVHALLWGATVAVVISIVFNTVAAVLFGSAVSAVVSAPLVEEATKALVLVLCLRRGEVDGPMDGIIYVSWSALGFAAVENMSYFAGSSTVTELGVVFVLRGLLTPFAHPLFTMWVGLLVGLAVQRNKSRLGYGLLGYVLAVASHAAWNGSLVLSWTFNATLVLLVAIVGFVLLFTATVAALIVVRRRHMRSFTSLVPLLASRYSLSPAECATFTTWSAMSRARRSVPRRHRWRFDLVHAAIARLVLLYPHAGSSAGHLIDPVREQVLQQQLQVARATFAAAR
jgi:protease PrsW